MNRIRMKARNTPLWYTLPLHEWSMAKMYNKEIKFMNGFWLLVKILRRGYFECLFVCWCLRIAPLTCFIQCKIQMNGNVGPVYRSMSEIKYNARYLFSATVLDWDFVCVCGGPVGGFILFYTEYKYWNNMWNVTHKFCFGPNNSKIGNVYNRVLS